MNKYLITLAAAAGTTAALAGSAHAASGVGAAAKVHEVTRGESLSVIAQNEGLSSWRLLWDANSQVTNPNLIFAGQRLTVPIGAVAERPLPQAGATGVAKPAAQTQASSGSATTNQFAGNGNVDALMSRTRMRESSNNYATNTGNGYYGAYQFDLQTWQSVGGKGLPSDASPAEQDMRAKLLYAQRGCQPWPNTCF